jgi:hypothetical protein
MIAVFIAPRCCDNPVSSGEITAGTTQMQKAYDGGRSGRIDPSSGSRRKITLNYYQ